MANTKTGSGELSGFLGEGTELNGEIRFADTLRVDGKIHGKVISENELIVGETGEVDAEVVVGTVSVTGKMSGSVSVKKRMVIHRNGTVRADLQLEGPFLVIEEGGIFEGSVRMEPGRDLEREKEKEKRIRRTMPEVAVLDS